MWEDETGGVDRWYVVVRDGSGGDLLTDSVDAPRWRPSEESWRQIKQQSLERDAEVIVAGVAHDEVATVLSSARVHIRTSKDPVGDSLFYREVPLPFLKAVQDPSRIRWRFGTIDLESGPPIVLQNLPVCGNCHSFADNGSMLGLDVDYGNDKGAYGIMPVSKHMVMDDEKIITWADYKREDGELTFGLLSRVSPTGRYVISTVKDRSVFVAIPDLMISQLFFPIKGILVVYDRETKTYAALPGADDPQYVQSNAVWSPDGKEIVFARAKAYHAGAPRPAEQRPGRRKGRPGVHRREEALSLRPVPDPVQRREGRNAGAARGRLGQRDEQLLPEVLAGRQVDRLLQGQELHAAAARQRAVHHPGRGRRRPTPALQHRRA